MEIGASFSPRHDGRQSVHIYCSSYSDAHSIIHYRRADTFPVRSKETRTRNVMLRFTSKMARSKTAVILAASCVALCIAVNEAATMECATGWNSEVKAIPEDWINDGYCDCPLDGRDEPDTDACSGSQAWPGVTGIHGTGNDSENSPPLTFECPEQPNLKLPLSRVNDGICDCCDGADEDGDGEGKGVCEDICAEVLRAERESRLRLEVSFASGHNKRKHELYAFKKLRDEKLKELEELDDKKKDLNPDAVSNQMDDLKLDYLVKRTETMNGVVETSLDILKGLTAKELRAFIVHACQLAGEMSKEDTTTCMALRLAGLDVATTWGDDDFITLVDMEAKSADSLELASRLFANAAHHEFNWELDIGHNKGNSRRRLDDMINDDEADHPDDDYHGHYDDDYPMEDEYDHDDEEHERLRNREKDKTPKQDELSGHEKELFDAVKTLPFSDARAAFLERSHELLAEITKILEADEEVEIENNSEEDEGGNTIGEAKEKVATVDPSAYTMMRASLGRKEGTIYKGFRWGASALLFVSANADMPDDMIQKLAILTVYHGNLSAAQVWQIMQKVVDDFAVPQSDDETCASPWAGSCPPTTVTRDGASIPPPTIIQAAEMFCSLQAEVTMEACAAKNMDANGIPIAIPDGYYGYSAPIERDEIGPLAALFAPLFSLSVDRHGWEELEEEKDRIDKLKKEIEEDIKETWKGIGGRNGDTMGPNGELHALADKCFDVMAGKYTYEVCIFGEAKQKEGPTGGTKLGRFTKMDYDEETGERILRWENGVKCWNGPNRSATVYVTCGAETKVLSADEPDTCSYVLQMESHIACDETYKKKMDL